jgi:predicted amidohydrolase YtcJ
VVAFGTDWPVAPLNPLLGVYAAVTRRTADGKNPDGWIPEQKISVEEALSCYTRNSAYAIFAENRVGTLKAGKLADIVVLSASPFKVAPEAIKDISVVQTFVGGKSVHWTR